MFHNVNGEPIPIHLDSATYLIDTKTVNSEPMYPLSQSLEVSIRSMEEN